MTYERTLERELGEWINAGPNEIADRAFDEIESRVRATRQRALWHISIGRASTRREVRVVLVAAALLASITIGLWLVGRPPVTIPVPTPPPTADASGALVPTAGSSGGPATAPATVSHAGQFEVPFSVTLVDHWLAGTAMPRWLSYYRNAGAETIRVSSIATTRVRPPGTTVANYDDMDSWPSDIYAWLTADPALTVRAPVSTTIGGRPATIVDFEWAPAAAGQSAIYFSAPPLERETTTVALFRVETNRIIEVRTGPNAGVIVFLNMPRAKFDAVAAEVDALLATLTFDSGPRESFGPQVGSDTNPPLAP